MLIAERKELKVARKRQGSGYLNLSEMDQRWVLSEIAKGRTDAREGRVSSLPKTFDGFLEEVGLENLSRRAYR